jgi:cell division protein FtsZ
MAIAEQGIQELQQFVDTLIVIPNQNLFRIANEKTTFSDAFAMADQVLHSGVRGVTDLMVMPGLINLDFADVRTVMAEMGKAVMGTGEAEGEARATEAAQAAISNPLLDDLSITGAQGVLINITGGMDMTLFEVDEAADHIRKEVDPNANIIVGSTFNDDLTGRMRVSVVATGLGGEAVALPRPASRVTTLHSPVRTLAPAAVIDAPIQPALPAELAAIDLVDPVDPPAKGIAVPGSDDEPFDLAKSLSAAGESHELDGGSDDALEVAQLSVVGENPAPSAPERPDQVEAHILREVRKSQAELSRTPVEENPKTVAGGKPGLRASLLARVTGVGRGKPKDSGPDMSPALAGTAALRTEPVMGEIRETPIKPIEPKEAKPDATTFGEVTPTERSVPSPSDDDQLEIPAFLRRQAN